MDELDRVLARALEEVIEASASIAGVCDKAEHLEGIDRSAVVTASDQLRSAGFALAQQLQVNLVAAYARRLTAVEKRSPLFPVDGVDCGAMAAEARSLARLQTIQANHDRLYHIDVVGLSRFEQLRHYSFHLSKLVGSLSRLRRDRSRLRDFEQSRLPDLLLFSIKLATLVNHRLPDDGLGSP